MGRKAADKDIKEALQRLDRLTQDELRNVAAQIFGVVGKMAKDVNELNRKSSPNISQYYLEALRFVWQEPGCEQISEAGSPPRIRPKITTSPANHDTKTPGRGLLTARYSQNGRLLDRVPSYGLMGNVSYLPELTFFQTLMDSHS